MYTTTPWLPISPDWSYSPYRSHDVSRAPHNPIHASPRTRNPSLAPEQQRTTYLSSQSSIPQPHRWNQFRPLRNADDIAVVVHIKSILAAVIIHVSTVARDLLRQETCGVTIGDKTGIIDRSHQYRHACYARRATRWSIDRRDTVP